MDERNLCLHELFERQVRRTPDATAVVDARTTLTYAELDRRADVLAAHLRSAGVAPDAAVGVYMERCAEYVVAILAAMKAGGAFVPLELAYPPSQLEDVLSDCEPIVVLTKEAHAGRLPDWQRGFRMDVEEPATSDETPEPPRVDRENLAFIPYSSGTTGKPKGIANPHRAPVLSYLWRYGISDYGPDDRVGCSVFFVWEVLRPLLRGGASYVIGDDVIYDPPALVRYLEEHRITEIQMTSSLTEAVLDASGPDLAERLPDLKTVWVCGEVVTKTLARRLLEALPHTCSYNLYSIAETHEVAVTELGEALGHPESTYCPVGRPARPERLYVLDDGLRRVPEGEPGEVVVGGEMLARGFVNLPEKTAERFVPDPFAGEGGARMYRTGDRGRMLSDGHLEILGRADFRVRIRGYNVELGAVEAAIETRLAVRACVVVSEGDEGEDKRLVAYVVPEPEDDHRFSGWDLDPKTGRSKEIRSALRDALPHYAVPAVYVELDALPIQDTSGKVDRKKLPPSPPRQARPGRDGDLSGVRLTADASRSEKEDLLKRIWEETLRLDEDEVETDDNFFDLGGHSLAAAQLSGRVEEGFGVHVSMPLFMEDPTVGGLCDRIEALQRDEDGEARPSEVDLRAEAVLEPEILPEGGETKDLRNAENVFLTGATGFLGAFLLDGLLSSTGARVHCLVREREDEDPIETIASNLESYGLPVDGMDRVVPVVGDLGEPLLGMDPEKFDALAREADLVIHAAAAVNLVYPYPALKAPNVGGTREALRLACRRRTKPFHFVSTDGIFPPDAELCEEDTDLDSLAEAREDGYGRSKWVAEKLVREAAGRGLPACVYRPGFISGHSETGASNPRDLQGAVLSESLRLGAAPEVDGWRLEMTPVDFVAAAILDVASKPEALGGTYHLANPEPVPAETVFDWLEEGGYVLDLVPHEEWSNRLEAAPPEDENGPGGVLRGASPDAADLSDNNVYDDRNTRRILGEDGPTRPDLNEDLILTYARYFAARGWAPEPASLQESGRQG
ncbi:amino acid adenylation domain-containing protein [Rubrobacter tropicus]|uniref:Amino acid adenylation domain-containing protein n=1 Tax=Rubrobacter tropicus TaxID=2653851 RepID=A0A6G8Q4G8_9ACTN|nr:non-ribosomal peptide synthetase [Rubrobacter tropicus]QIN81356.1 amino acid adenylation domain-containing protein [Rubrobacter tropicus]